MIEFQGDFTLLPPVVYFYLPRDIPPLTTRHSLRHGTKAEDLNSLPDNETTT